MKLIKCLTLFLTLILFPRHLYSQKDFFKTKANDISTVDFAPKAYEIDSSAPAIFLLDMGATNFEGNESGWFNYVFKRVARIRILNKNGYNAAVWKIMLYQSNNKSEVLSDLKAFTYNLENGKVVKTNLSYKDIFESSLNKNYLEKKFTLSGVKEGSIIEISYTITSPFIFNLQAWAFQDSEYPRLWTEYQIGIPALLSYFFIKHGVNSFYAKKSWQKQESFSVQDKAPASGIYNFGAKEDIRVSTTVNYFSWAMKDVPAFKVENYITSSRNYINELEFQLSSTYNGESIDRSYANWSKASQSLLGYADFGGALQEDINAIDLDKVITTGSDELITARTIYNYIKDNFTCTDYNNMYIKSGLQNVINNRRGTVGEINLLLINKLRKYGINAEPVILSTRDHGFSNSTFPIINKFNYVICKSVINGNTYLLDAAYSNLGFGNLAGNCYNGEGIVIKNTPEKIILSADSLQETKLTSVFFFNEKKGMEGTFNSNYGKVESFNIRSKLSVTNQQEFFKNINNNSASIEINNPSIESSQDLEFPLTIKCDLKFSPDEGDIIYFNPIIGEGLEENTFFKSSTRLYPVEMPYCIDETYLLNMEIPNGYMVDEMPKSTRIKLNENDGFFEYLIGKARNSIQLRCRFKLNKANFAPEFYQSLRDFVAYAVKIEAEQIVFKKIK